MSMVEKIGRFIIEYQFEVEMALGLLVALIFVVLIIKAMRNSRRKRELLSQINDTVSEINSTVNGLGTKKADVIYIDNRSPQGAPPAEIFSPEEEKKVADEDGEFSTEEEYSKETTENPEKDDQETKPKIKYFERDCATDKHGKIYTIEELKEQIKE